MIRKPETKSVAVTDEAGTKSIVELVSQHIPDGKFDGLTKLLKPFERPRPAQRD